MATPTSSPSAPKLAIAASPHPGFNVATKQIRAYARAFCQTREPSALATLTLATR